MGSEDGTGATDNIAHTAISKIEKDNKYALLGDEADHNNYEFSGEIALGDEEINNDRKKQTENKN